MNNNQQQAHVTEEQKDEGLLFYACQTGLEQTNQQWLVDSACSSHMTADKSIFKELKPFDLKVCIGNGE